MPSAVSSGAYYLEFFTDNCKSPLYVMYKFYIVPRHVGFSLNI